MSQGNVTIITGVGRIGVFPHLDQPYSHQTGKDPKYSFSLMFPKTGVLPFTDINGGQIPSGSTTEIEAALNQATQQAWGLPDWRNAAVQRQVQFPPTFKDGDQDWKKDDQGNLMVQIDPSTNQIVSGTPYESSAGNWMINLSNKDPIGLAQRQPDGTNANIGANEVYAGCWVMVQIEVSAYTSKQGANIIALKPLNILRIYDGERLGGGGAPAQSAVDAFATVNVAASQNSVQQVAPQMPQAAPPNAAGQMAGQPPQMPPQQPQVPQQAAVPPQMPPQQPAGNVPPQSPAVTANAGQPPVTAATPPNTVPTAAPAGNAPQAAGQVPDYTNPATTQGVTPQAPTQPATPPPVEKTYTVQGAQYTAAQLLSGGWTQAQIDALGQ